jgi:hypothetical protein
MTQISEAVKKFWVDGLLTSHEILDVERELALEEDIIILSNPTESTDPDWYPADMLASAKRSAAAYLRLFLFENKVRQLIERVLLEAKGITWFDIAVPKEVKDEALRIKSKEETAKFHSHRGDSLLYYVNLPDLGKIIEENWSEFEDILFKKGWVIGKFEELRLTRNSISHMCEISMDDIERLDMILRDWNRQVG